ELERICLKALAKRASDRYETPQAMAADLLHFEAMLLQQRYGAEDLSEAEDHGSQADTARASDGGETSRSGLVSARTGASAARPGPIVPKGLRPFDAGDADFFLDLLQGPRDQNGLPESLRFWKTRIESIGPDEPFRVGLLYGPSGCGKSSLVRAGLLPRLGSSVTAVYVDATLGETEGLILKALRQRIPGVPP